jgi:hypothetical protein
VNAYNLLFLADFVQDLFLHRKQAGLVFIDMLLYFIHGGFDVAFSSRDLCLQVFLIHAPPVQSIHLHLFLMPVKRLILPDDFLVDRFV